MTAADDNAREDNAMTALDENTRRYYLDTMGIQCWQLLAGNQSASSLEQALAITQAVSGSTEAAVNWPQLETAIQQCELCSLHNSRNHGLTGASIAGTGDKESSLMFVVLSPDDRGALLSVQAKALFEKMLAAIELSIDKIYLTPLLKCPVPAEHTVSAKEIGSCKQALKQQIQLVQPKQLIILGDTAVRCLLQKDLSLDDFRDSYNTSQHNIEKVPLFVSYSPEELLLQPENKRKAWNDLQQLQKNLAIDNGI